MSAMFAALLLIQPAQTSEDQAACIQMKDIAVGVTSELPMMVDIVTRMDGMSVICSLRTVSWNKFIVTDIAKMRDGWRDRKQNQFNNIVCNNEAFRPMAQRGWRFVQNLTFESGERIIMDANCRKDS